MSGTTVTTNFPTGLSLTETPTTIASGVTIGNAAGPAVYGPGATDWAVTNSGLIQSTGAGTIDVGVSLANGSVTNLAGGRIDGYFAVGLTNGVVVNAFAGVIDGSALGVYLSDSGNVDNAGVVSAGTAGYAIGSRDGGTIVNETTGTITAVSSGVVLGHHGGTLGSVTNFGSIASTGTYSSSAGGGGYAGIYLRTSGMVTNAEGARITSKWKGVAIGYRPSAGGEPTLNGTLDNSGYIYANDAGSAGAAVWVRSSVGVVLNNSTGTIEGGPFGIVGYYGITVVNSGTIGGAEYAVFDQKGANLIEMAPGAVFSGQVQGGVEGTLELLSGTGAGSLTDFGTQYTGFGEVSIASGATWSVAGTVSSGTTLAFAGNDQVKLADPAKMAGTIDSFVTGDSLVLAGIFNVTSATINASDQIVVDDTDGLAVTLQLDPSRHDPAGTNIKFATVAGGTELIACFAAGTRIATEAGEIPVEALAEGMRVRSPFGGTHEVVWLGHRRTDCSRHPNPEDVWPVRVAASAFGPGLPMRDLWLSPDHAVLASGALIPVRCLLNGRSIAQVRRDAVTYWHVELPRHDIVLAEGLPCESYLDTGNRAAFENGGAAVMLQPEFARRTWDAEACLPQLRGGPLVEATRLFLERRASMMARAGTAG